MKYFILTTFAIMITLSSVKGNEIEVNGKLKGKIIDSKTGNEISNANIFIKHTNYYSVSDQSGNYLIEGITPGNYELVVSHIGYKNAVIIINIKYGEFSELLLELIPSIIQLGEVIVSSPKYLQIVKEVPLPLEIVNRQLIDRNSPNSLSDLLTIEPGLTIQRDAVWASAISVRGLSKNNLVTLIDGNRIETSNNLAASLSLVDLNDIGRVEVIKGAASSLYGSGATGGVINILTRQGKFTDGFSLSGSMNSAYNTVNRGSAGNLNLSASSTNWYVNFGTSIRYADDMKTPFETLDNSQFRDNNISANLGITPFENHEVKLSFQQFKAKDVGIPGGEPFPGESKATYKEASREMYSISYSINSLLPSMSNVTLKYFYQDIFRDVEIIPNQNVIINPYAAHKIHGAQLQTQWVLNENNFLVAGLDFWQREYDGKRERTVISQKLKFIEEPVPNSKFLSLGLFAQNELKLNDKVKLILGGRIDQIHVSNDNSFIPVSVVSIDPNTIPPDYYRKLIWAESSADDFSWSTNISALYKLSNEIDLTLNLGRSFRSPSLEERYEYIELGGAKYYGDPNLNPEQGLFIDGGLRYWTDNFSVRSNVFINLMNDLVIDHQVNDTLYIKKNVGSARFYGFELTSEFNPFDEIILYGNVSFVRGEDTKENENLPQIPPLNGILGFKTNFLEAVDLDLNSTWYTKQDKVAEGESITPGYLALNLYLSSSPVSLGFANARLHGGIENMLDKAYRNHLSTYRGITRLEAGRNFFVKLNLDW